MTMTPGHRSLRIECLAPDNHARHPDGLTLTAEDAGRRLAHAPNVPKTQM
jgi:hypothetical protein